jgi:hypothetical protein
MPKFRVREVTKPRQMPEAWLAGVTIIEDDREHEFHVLIPDRAQGEPTSEWIEAQLRAMLSDHTQSAVDQLADRLRPYYGSRQAVIHLQVHGND